MALRILGIMTGTSCDQLDAVCLNFSGEKWEFLWAKSERIPTALREKVFKFQEPAQRHSSEAWLRLNTELGIWYGKSINSILRKTDPKRRPHLIANHGQTLAHFPHFKGDRSHGGTLQMGDPTHIAFLTGLTVISNFREGDLAAGGEGAPLAPAFHRSLLQKSGLSKTGISIHNLGGISNLTYFHPSKPIVLAFDTGPANLWIDEAVRQMSRGKKSYDSGGKIALANRPDLVAVGEILEHPYFSQLPPKSTGRDDFPFEIFQRKTRTLPPPIRVASATEITVRSIVDSYKKWILKPGYPLNFIFLSGGGAKNLAIKKGLQKGLPDVHIKTIEDLGLNAQWIEGAAFAFLGYQTLLGRSLGGIWTGAKGFAPPAHIIPGKNWKEVLKALG